MSKILSGLIILVGLAGQAMALNPPVAVPGPAIDGGILGLVLAGGVVYLLNRRGRSRS